MSRVLAVFLFAAVFAMASAQYIYSGVPATQYYPTAYTAGVVPTTYSAGYTGAYGYGYNTVGYAGYPTAYAGAYPAYGYSSLYYKK